MVDFLKYKLIYFLISVLVIGAGLFSISRWGYDFSIDFVGGTNINYQLTKDIDGKVLEESLKKNKIEEIDYQLENKKLILRAKPIDEKKEAAFKSDLEKETGKITVLSSETVGPTLGRETVMKTTFASLLAVLGILIYMSFAFKGFKFAVAAVLAMIHDLLVVVGTYSLLSHFFGAQFDAMFVTAVLTTMSFSVHDTIVIFDKMREYMGSGEGTIESLANRALQETMVRSLNNSMTIVFMLLALSMLGGSTIRFFIIALLIGTMTGTYSSPFVATPILVWLEKRKRK
ncbi:protein-export membrane protein SecF [Candidatus Roizmanbacteria bacterium RIFCSPLOWO2_01_FULL_44_13]|uniref:Protein-export membrane protein SecF n=1 Tax=Candidatus Roizmanbacteria bacterium RIFCSPLOWO2_01_FULL_44_13 TaxID=1802069 RepID=A0A1F7JAQ5_9BACT|nr:MAG: protein-export membrane protein SecF [Candidatus Roizmanbacteria bacterium RIFCSPLOWO2_01_FULL_44_13]